MTSPPPEPGPPVPVPNPLMPHPLTLTCIQCGQAFHCDVSSQAARDQTCGPCAISPAPSGTDHR